MSFYRLSIKLVEMPERDLDKFYNPSLVMKFDGQPEDHTEDWTIGLYPEEVKQRLRAGLANYARSEMRLPH